MSNKLPTTTRDFILHLHVADRAKWNRAKGILVALLTAGALVAIGGLEGEETPNAPLAFLLLAGAGALIWSIERTGRRRG